MEWQLSQLVPAGTCVWVLPVAMVPLWQLAQVPVTWVWSTRVTGRHTDVVWQFSQVAVDVMCVLLLPVARVPLWQVEQPLVMPVWLKVAGFQAVVP